jgi:NADH-quinone oxidoreductase subunit E
MATLPVQDDVALPEAGYSELVPELLRIQQEHRYLPEDALVELAERLNVSLSQVYSVATFYKAFSLTPRGKHTCSVCMGTACHVRGAGMVLEEAERQLGVEAGQTSEDGSFTLERVNCVGACALGPVVVVDGKVHEHMSLRKLRSVIEDIRFDDELEADENDA